MKDGAFAAVSTSPSVVVVSSTAGTLLCLCLPFPERVGDAAEAMCVWNFTTWPAVLETTTFSMRQVRPSMCVGKRIDADAGPAQLLEGLGVRADRAVA